MIELRTGLPGAGKTLFALKHVRDLAEKDKRPVYFFNVSGLNVPGWIELDEAQALEWFKLPANSIILIDEAQRIFRPRHYAKEVPPHVAQLETHRHLGLDIVLITQHPGLIDSNVRRLCGKHLHFVRAFGSGVVVQHEWAEVNGEVDKSRADSISTTLKHPTEVYGWYKSAEVHTVKRRIPARILGLAIIPFALALCGWIGYGWFSSKIEGKKPDAGAQPAQTAPAVARQASAPALDYFEAQRPRLSSLPHTAPAFDGAMAVKAAPFPAACAASASRCSCYTDQATILDVPESLCREIVAKGIFDPRLSPSQPAQAASGGMVGKAPLPS